MKNPDKKFLERLGTKIKKKNHTIAMAESVTAGLLQWTVASIPDASCFLQGGITAYNIGQKYRHLRVEPIHAQSVDCVSPTVATSMAISVTEMFASDWGLALTGYATPVPVANNRMYAYYAISFHGMIKAKGKIAGGNDDPSAIQQHFVQYLLKKFERLL